jgi:cytochrome P450
VSQNVIPYYPGAPLVGALNELRADQVGFMMRMRRTYGEVVEFPLLMLRMILVANPELIQAVLVTHADKIRKSDIDHAVLRQALGNGLLPNEGESHRYQRRLMQPAFHHKRIEGYGQTTIDFTEKMLAAWRDGMELDMFEAMTTLTLYVVSKVLYDADVSGEARMVGESVEAFSRNGERQYMQGFVLPSWVPTSENRAIRKAIARIDSVIVPIIEARRASGEDRGDLLSMLLSAQDEETGVGMSDKQVRDEAVTLFMAGHETTSNTLAWTWILLSRNPDAEAKLHAELDSVLGGRAITPADLPRLKYLDWVIKEALRLYPPAWAISWRVPQEDLHINGYTFAKGKLLFISPYVVHRDVRWFPEPDAFIPERWADDLEKRIPRYAYFPFGGGPRICIGNSFALMEARLIVGAIAQRYRVQLDPAHPIIPEALITLRPKGRLPMRLSARVTSPVEGSEQAG